MSSNQLLLGLARKYPFRIGLNVILGFSGALFNGVSTVLMVPVLLSLLGQEAILESGPPIISRLTAPFERLPEDYRLLAMAGAIIFILALKNLTTYISALASNSLGRALSASLQEQGLKILLDVDLDYFSKSKVGDLVNRLGGEMGRATSTINAFVNIIVTSITIFVFLSILVSISWQLTLAAAFLLPISTFITQRLVLQSKKFSKIITSINHDYTSGLIEVLGGIRLVKATGSELREFKRFEHLIRKREKIEFQAKTSSAAIGPIGEITNVVVLFLLALLSRALFAGQLEALSGILLTYLLVLFRLLPLVSQLNGIRSGLARYSASVEVVYDLLRRDNKAFMPNGAVPFSKIQNAIRFEKVFFAYPGTSEAVLQDITLSIPKGTTLALVGSSGAGKSTLADLLPRFYDPTAGSITLDGKDMCEFDIQTIRRAMGIVSQDTFLFNDSLRHNIAYGFPEATEEQIIEAIKRANAYEFIVRLPQGLETPIGDRGVMLSGGQRQRIAIARALLKNPEILILDEATSALDTVSERLVQKALDELSRERTTLVIAHRLSTVQKADKIAVLDRGRVVELGTHIELLKKNGHYKKLYDMQFSETARKESSTFDDQKQVFVQASYEFRARLNAMIGSLGLLADGLVDNQGEQDELVDEAYRSAVELFKTVRQLETATESISRPSENAKE